MPTIKLSTQIHAPIHAVFDAARNIDLHQGSMEHTSERAIAGRTSGLIELGETVTWEARHFGLMQKLTVKITHMNAPHSFTDEMVSGAFHSFSHSHTFEEIEPQKTRMIDVFEYKSPLGVIREIPDFIFLKSYMTRLLETRNHYLKQQLDAMI